MVRFNFGKNWLSYSARLNEERLEIAIMSLQDLLGKDCLKGLTFLDIGSGSGIMSAAARRLGASVVSFDYDMFSVECTRKCKQKFSPNDQLWSIEQGSILDEEYTRSLGSFDIVYSWGVLHHTGKMWQAINNLFDLAKGPDSLVAISLYNDQGWKSRLWRIEKKLYSSGGLYRPLLYTLLVPVFLLIGMIIGIIRFKNPLGFFHQYKKKRGMSPYYDILDWIGGYPFEVASPQTVFHAFKERGYKLVNLMTVYGWGCNQFVFQKEPANP